MTAGNNEAYGTVDFATTIEEDYGKYAALTNIGRAMSSVIDGLKPVQRRVLYSMFNSGYYPNKKPAKSLMVVGNTIGHYHPHGDCYDSITNMANMSTRIHLVDIHGSQGEHFGDKPAAPRYTESSLSPAGVLLVDEIKDGFVEMEDNYDGTEKIAKYLPAQFPNLLINGSTGMAVAYSSTIPQHNPDEVIEAVKYRIEHPNCTVDDIMKIMPGPDYSTGGIISLEESDIRSYYETGSGHITISGEYVVEGSEIVITSLPYGVSPESIRETINKKVLDGSIVGVSECKDLTDLKRGMSIRVYVKRGYSVDHVLAQLMQKTNFTTKIYPLLNAIDEKGVTRVYSVLELLDKFIEHRGIFVRQRSANRKVSLEKRLSVIDAIMAILVDVDKAVAIIRSSRTPATARKKLSDEFGIDSDQAEHILSMQLRTLTNQNVSALKKEKVEVEKNIAKLDTLMKDDDALNALVAKESYDVLPIISDKRRTTIVSSFDVDAAAVKEATSTQKSDTGWYVNDGGEFTTSGTPFNTGDSFVMLFDDGRIKFTTGSGLPKNPSPTPAAPSLDGLVSSMVVSEGEDVAIIMKSGKILRIDGSSVRPQGIAGNGVKGITFSDDTIVGMCAVNDKGSVLTISDSGWKVTKVKDIPVKGRGATGVMVHKLGKSDTGVYDYGYGACFTVNDKKAPATPRSKATKKETVEEWGIEN